MFNLPAKDNYVFVNHNRQTAIGETEHAAFEHFFTSMENGKCFFQIHIFVGFEIIKTFLGYDDSNLNSHEFMPNFYHQTVKDAHEVGGRSFGAFLSNHLDTMSQRGPDNVDGSKYTSEVKFCHID